MGIFKIRTLKEKVWTKTKSVRKLNCKETNKMLQFLVYTTIISLSLGAPQYGGVQPSPPVKTAPLTGSVQCDRVCHPVGHRVQGNRDRGVHHRVSEDFVLSSHIDTVCLPQAEELFDGTTCFATGWGKDKFGSA